MRLYVLFMSLLCAEAARIFHGSSASLPAAELRRYLYLLFGDLKSTLPLEKMAPYNQETGSTARSVVVGGAHELSRFTATLSKDGIEIPQMANGYFIARGRTMDVVVGADSQNTLYGVYGYLEQFGARFSLAGPALPTRSSSAAVFEAVLPIGWSTQAEPIFTTRGLQPFHDFSEGPDWWSEDMHKVVCPIASFLQSNNRFYLADGLGEHSGHEGQHHRLPYVSIGGASGVGWASGGRQCGRHGDHRLPHHLVQLPPHRVGLQRHEYIVLSVRYRWPVRR